MKIKVAIIEDHQEFRESISFILNSTDGFKCVGKFKSMEEALHDLPDADIFLCDINLPGMTGIKGIARIKTKYPESKVIMLTVFENNETILESLLSGANGYLLKKTPPVRVLQALEDAMLGGYPMTPSVAKQTLDFFKDRFTILNEDEKLTIREKEILSLIVDGLENEEIAEKLFISMQTVRNHIRHIYGKLQVHSRSQAVIKAMKKRIL